MSLWYTYVLICSDSSYYIGMTNDLTRHLTLHNQGKAATWTEQRRPVRYIFAEEVHTKAEARSRELALKGWRRGKKEQLFGTERNLFRQTKE